MAPRRADTRSFRERPAADRIQDLDDQIAGGRFGSRRHRQPLGWRHDRAVIKEDAMASRLNPYISFPGNARDAMEFYQTVFGGNLTVSTFGEFGSQDAAVADKVMHAMLETDRGYTLMASDLAPGMEHTPGNNIAISLSGDEGDELHGYWEKLTDRGQVNMPLEKQVWGDEFGMVTDRFGIPWLVNIGQPQA
jgi:PhnB protein